MKDILFEEHLNAVKDSRKFGIGGIEGQYETAEYTSKLTRKHMNGFVRWTALNDWHYDIIEEDWYLNTYDGKARSTEELIDKYFESLNKP